MIGFAGDVQLGRPLEVGDTIMFSILFSPLVALLRVLVAWSCYRRGYNGLVWGVVCFSPQLDS